MPTLTETIMKSRQLTRVIVSFSVVAIVGIITYNWAVSPQASYVKAAQRYENISQDVDKQVRLLNNSIRIKRSKVEKIHETINSSAVIFFSPEQASDFFAELE
jgi:hypothetical protein